MGWGSNNVAAQAVEELGGLSTLAASDQVSCAGERVDGQQLTRGGVMARSGLAGRTHIWVLCVSEVMHRCPTTQRSLNKSKI
jgi:hypothetical protein